MKSLSEPMKPNERQSAHPEDGRALRAVPTTVLGLALIVAAWFWLARQPLQVSADILQGILIVGMAASVLSLVKGLITDLRGKDSMEMLATGGHWIATLFASVVLALLVIGLLIVVWYYAGQ